ncbi:hypothetical protein SMALA_1512 [Streptomyces malaysiensis subsp. malaysiensis]|nr:hypothetical protein SMALA_1512 [Streptomyces malaysiensis]
MTGGADSHRGGRLGRLRRGAACDQAVWIGSGGSGQGGLAGGQNRLLDHGAQRRRLRIDTGTTGSALVEAEEAQGGKEAGRSGDADGARRADAHRGRPWPRVARGVLAGGSAVGAMLHTQVRRRLRGGGYRLTRGGRLDLRGHGLGGRAWW